MRRSLLSGYYGQHNCGDDAFVLVCAAALLQSGIDHVGVLGAVLPKEAPRGTVRMESARRWWGLAQRIEDMRRLRWLSQGANVILGGGSVLRDTTGVSRILAMLDASPATTHRAVGVSIGPFRDSAAERLVAELLPRMEFVGVRDQESLDLGVALAPAASITRTFDLAALLPALYQLEPPVAGRSETLGIALCRSAVSEAELVALASSLRTAIDRGIVPRVALISMNSHHRKGDVHCHHRVAEHLDRPAHVEHWDYDGSPLAMWRRIASLRGLVAMRLHAAVFAYTAQVPTFLVPYQEKSTAWAAMVGHPAGLVGGLAQLHDGAWTELMSGHAPLPGHPLDLAVQSAWQNFASPGAS